MASFQQIMNGLVILNRYHEVGDHGNVLAFHDEISASGFHPALMTKADVNELDKQGWQWDTESDTWRHYI